ncbi:MAG: hypothetical protein V1897_10835 [Pseudomonadota bacterium]
MTGEKWLMDETEINWYKKFNVPPSERAPLTRLKILGSYFTNFQWWWHKHPETGKPVLSGYNPNSGTKVLPDAEWFDTDFSSISLDLDSTEPFLDQFRKLQVQVPSAATRNFKEPENSISLTSFGDQNSYFTIACRSKGSFFGMDAFDIENTALTAYVHNASDSFNLLQSNRIHNSQYIRSSYDCMNCTFLFDCRNCEFCFGATNKRNKKYLFFNEQLNKDEWEKRVKEIDLGQREVLDEYQKRFMEMMARDTVWPESFSERVENVTGEYIQDSSDIVDGWFVSKNNRNMYKIFVMVENNHDCAYCAGLMDTSFGYSLVACPATANCKFCMQCKQCQDLEYSISCINCEFCFGCVGLQRKKFCIFNQQHSEEEYWQKVDELKCAMLDRGEYGEFFPPSFSPSYFLESGSAAIFGSGKKDAEAIGAGMYDPNEGGASGFDPYDPEKDKTVDDIPDSIDDFSPEQWANVPIYDPEVDRKFSFLKPEIEFYQRFRISPPKDHFIRRILGLQHEMNKAVFEDILCDECGTNMHVAKNLTYIDRKVYCKKCYLNYLEKYG